MSSSPFLLHRSGQYVQIRADREPPDPASDMIRFLLPNPPCCVILRMGFPSSCPYGFPISSTIVNGSLQCRRLVSVLP
jgi:hypothetical protein